MHHATWPPRRRNRYRQMQGRATNQSMQLSHHPLSGHHGRMDWSVLLNVQPFLQQYNIGDVSYTYHHQAAPAVTPARFSRQVWRNVTISTRHLLLSPITHGCTTLTHMSVARCRVPEVRVLCHWRPDFGGGHAGRPCVVRAAGRPNVSAEQQRDTSCHGGAGGAGVCWDRDLWVCAVVEPNLGIPTLMAIFHIRLRDFFPCHKGTLCLRISACK